MDNPQPIKIIDENTAWKKAQHYCAYQERSQHEVRNKLYEWGLKLSIVEDIISRLIVENFLNEERFAKAYAKGKFSQKGWGKLKIKQGLKFKQVPDVLIKKALQSIDGDEYLQTLQTILNKKAEILSEKDLFKRKYKLQQYALSRGYESDLVGDAISELNF